MGMIGKVESGGMQKRFDGKTENHYHARCLSCGRLDDLPMEPQTLMEEKIKKLTDYDITGHRLEFVGLCASCKKKPYAKIRTASKRQVRKK